MKWRLRHWGSVGLARALATDADLLLMDESFSALDPLIRRDMQDQLLELQKTLRKTIVFITHDLNEAMRLGDRIAVVRDGRIVQTGTAEDILPRPADEADCGCATATPDTPFTELCALSARLSHPVAVLDTAHAVVGVVPRQRLVGFLAEADGAPVVCDGGERVTARA